MEHKLLFESMIIIKLFPKVISSYKVPVPPTPCHTQTHHRLMFEVRRTLKREEMGKEIHLALLFPFLLVWSSLLWGLLYISLGVSASPDSRTTQLCYQGTSIPPERRKFFPPRKG